MFDLKELERAHAIVGTAVPPRRRRMPGRCWRSGWARMSWVKHENHTPTGAFKVRGGLVYLDRLKRERPNAPGSISATRGNHGQSLAFAARRAGVPAVIYVPRRQLGREERRDARLRRRADRAWRRLPGGARGSRIAARTRPAHGAVVPPRPRSRRRDLRARAVPAAPISTCSTCRSGRARASAAASSRATCSA